MKNKFLIWLLLLTGLAIGLSGCGVWYNFKAYFNSYYNAKVLFDQAEENIQKIPRDLFAFYEVNIQAQDYLSLNKVIEKCSKILQFDTKSSYFLDALWLSGKSFYYQREYVKAERKFKELQDNVQDPDELLLVNLWLGKTQMQLRNFDEGLKILETVAEDAVKYEEEEIFAEAVIKQIAFLIYKERFDEAIERCNAFIQNSTNKETNAEIAFALGNFYYKNKDYEKAATAFKSVADYSPTFETLYKSRLEYAKCLMDLGKLDESLELLDEMKNKSQYNKHLGDINVELGTVYYHKKDYAAALEIFTKVDTLYYGELSSGVAEYMKAQIYEYHLPNYDSALVYYEYASQNQEVSDEMKLQIGNKLNLMNKYITMRDDIKSTLKAIEYADNRNNYLRDSVLYVEAVYRDTTEARKRLLAMQGGAGQFQTGGQNMTGQNMAGQNMGGQANDFGQGSIPQNQNQFNPQQNQSNPQTSMGMQTGTSQGLTTQTGQNRLGLSESAQQGSQSFRQRGIRTVKKKALPPKPVMPVLKADSLKTLLASKYYSYGNLFFTDLEVPDSAAYFYNKVLNEYPVKSILPGTYYALGTYYLTQDKKEKADSLFKIVYNDYKTSEVGMQAAKKLGLIEEVPKTDPADSLYIAAEKKYYDKKFDEAIGEFRNIIGKFPKSKHAPRSAYFIAFIFENDLKNIDSTTAAYEFLMKEYPTSEAGSKAIKRSMVYQEEKARKQKEAEAEKKKAEAAAQPPAQQNAQKPQESIKKETARQDMGVDESMHPDSIKAMMRKALQKENRIQNLQKNADTLKVRKEKEL